MNFNVADDWIFLNQIQIGKTVPSLLNQIKDQISLVLLI
jgi:hypothetical protein